MSKLPRHQRACPEALKKEQELSKRKADKGTRLKEEVKYNAKKLTTGGKVLLNEMAFFMGMRKYANATAGQYSRMAKNSLIPHFESYYSEGKFVMDSLLWAFDASVTMPPLSTYIDQLADTSKCKVAIQAYKVLCHTVQHVVHKR